MAKRIFSFVIVLALLLSLMPQMTIGVFAEGTPAPGASEWCDHTSHEGWTPWGDDEAEKKTLPTEEGKYYLTSDVTMSAAVTINHNIHLCLNIRSELFTDKDQIFQYLKVLFTKLQISFGSPLGSLSPGVGSKCLLREP